MQYPSLLVADIRVSSNCCDVGGKGLSNASNGSWLAALAWNTQRHSLGFTTDLTCTRYTSLSLCFVAGSIHARFTIKLQKQCTKDYGSFEGSRKAIQRSSVVDDITMLLTSQKQSKHRALELHHSHICGQTVIRPVEWKYSTTSWVASVLPHIAQSLIAANNHRHCKLVDARVDHSKHVTCCVTWIFKVGTHQAASRLCRFDNVLRWVPLFPVLMISCA